METLAGCIVRKHFRQKLKVFSTEGLKSMVYMIKQKISLKVCLMAEVWMDSGIKLMGMMARTTTVQTKNLESNTSSEEVLLCV